MYEGKPKKSLNIDWKSLLIKMGILLVVIFLVLWIASLFKKDKKVLESNLSVNLQTMKSAATDYFTGSRLPSNVNGKKKITLGEMFDKKLVVEFRDQYNKSCDLIDSYAEATKLNDTDYTIKVKLVCGTESDYVINTVSFASDIVEPPVDNKDDINNPEPTPDDSTQTSTSTNNTTTKPSTTKPSTSTNTNKPTTSTTTKPITNVTTTKPSTNASTVTNTCTYGNKEYSSIYPVAYIIPGNCAVSRNDFYKAEYANKVSSISATEYAKLNNEMAALATKTGASLYIESPSYSGVYNKANDGLVGYQILFTMKQKVNYTTYTIYQYYIDQNGNRVAVIDKRNSITASKPVVNNPTSTTTNSTIRVNSVVLNRNAITLDVNESYYAYATISPSNATNKSISWVSADPKIATVNSAGKIIAKSAGVTTITATVDGISASIRVTVKQEATYQYCKLNTERVYSTGYIAAQDLTKYSNTTTTYNVTLNTNKTNVYDIEYGNLNTMNEYTAAYNYLVSRNKPLSLTGGSSSNGIDPGNAYSLRDHSLPNENYSPKVSYIGKNVNTLSFKVSVNYKNLTYINGRVPYYTSSTYGVFFIPLYFDVITLDTNNCASITSSQINTYVKNGYVRY